MSPRDITDLRRTKRYPPDAGQELCKRLRNSKKDHRDDGLVLRNSYAPHELTDRPQFNGYHDPDKVSSFLARSILPLAVISPRVCAPGNGRPAGSISRLPWAHYFGDPGVGSLVETASLELIGPRLPAEPTLDENILG